MKAITPILYLNAVLLSAPFTVLAQTSGTLDTLQVTGAPAPLYPVLDSTAATRLPARILDTDRSISVIDRQILEDRAIQDPQEAVQNVAGVQRAASFTGVGETFLVRGFFQQALFKDGFRAGGVQGAVSFSAAAPTDLANLQKIEVLKGPSAILFGRGEPGGTVNYVTSAPLFKNSLELTTEVGSDEFYRQELHGNWQPLPGKVALRLDTSYTTNESFIDQVNGERLFVAPSALWQIGPDTTLTLRTEYSQDDRSTIPGVPYANGEVIPGMAYDRYLGETDFTNVHTEAWRGLLTLEHRWNEHHSTTFSLHGARSQADGGYFILFNFFGPSYDPVTQQVSRASAQTDFEEEFLTARLDHLWEFTIYDAGTSTPSTTTDKDGKTVAAPVRGCGFPTVKNALLISGEYEKQTTDNQRNLSATTPISVVDPVYNGFTPSPLLPGLPIAFPEVSASEGEAYSLLVLNRISVGDIAFLSFGGRFESFEASNGYTYPATVPFPSSANESNEDTFNPSAGVVIKPTRNLALYGSYAESTFSFINIGRITATGESLDPERSRQFEIGAKAEWFGGKLFTTLAVFQIEKSDVGGTDPANPLFSINAGEERSRGVELEINGEPLPGWRVTANYAYIDSQVTDDPLGFNTGHRRFGVPENSGGVFTTYEIQEGPLKGFGLGGGVYLAGPVEIDNANTGNISGWAQTDAALYYKRGRYKAQINVKNLFDNEFYYSEGNNTKVLQANARALIASLTIKF